MPTNAASVIAPTDPVLPFVKTASQRTRIEHTGLDPQA